VKGAKWVIVLLLVAAIWGSTFALVKETLSTFGTFALLFLRFGIAALLLGIFCLLRRQKISNSELKNGAILGFFLFVSYAAQTWGLNFTSPTNSAFITGLFVIMAPILSALLFREKTERKIWLASALALAGLYILTGASTSFNPGDAITLLSALGYALQIVYAAKYLKKCNAISLVTVQLAVVALLSLFLMVALGETPAAYPLPAMGAVLFLALFATLFAQWGQLVSQEHLEPSRVVLVLITEPVFAMLYSVLFFGEVLSASSIAGAGLILAGMLIAEWPKGKKE